MVRWQWGGAGLHPLQLLVLLPAAALAALQVLAVELLQGSRAAAGVGVADAGRQVGDDPLRVVQVPGRPVPHGLPGHQNPGGGGPSGWPNNGGGKKKLLAGPGTNEQSKCINKNCQFAVRFGTDLEPGDHFRPHWPNFLFNSWHRTGKTIL